MPTIYALKGVSSNNTAVNARLSDISNRLYYIGRSNNKPNHIDTASFSKCRRYIFIKDAMGIANTHNIVVSGNGVNIDGLASYTMRNTY